MYSVIGLALCAHYRYRRRHTHFRHSPALPINDWKRMGAKSALWLLLP